MCLTSGIPTVGTLTTFEATFTVAVPTPTVTVPVPTPRSDTDKNAVVEVAVAVIPVGRTLYTSVLTPSKEKFGLILTALFFLTQELGKSPLRRYGVTALRELGRERLQRRGRVLPEPLR